MSETRQPDPSSVPDSEQLELKLPDESSTPKDLGLWAGVLVLLTLIAYWPSTTGSFIWRDERLAQQHWLLAPGGLSLAWFGRWEHPENYSLPTYQPVALTAYWLEYRAGGKTDKGLPSPMAYHIASLIFHAGAAVLLWLLLRELLLPRAWIVAAIFALHPIHAEAVSWISEQGTVLAGLFFIGSIYCYWMFIKWRERDAAEKADGKEGVDPAQTWGLYSGAVLLFLLAILSDPSAVMLPVVLLLVLWWKKKLTSQDGLLITPLVIVALALWISTADLHRDPREQNLLNADPSFMVVNVGRGLWFTVVRLVLPMHFSAMDFSTREMGRLAGVEFIFIAGVVALIIAGLAYFCLKDANQKRGPLVAVAIFFLLVCSSLNWFDASRLIPLTDCVAYLAIVPILILLIAALSRIKLPGPHPQSAVALCAAVLIVIGLLSWMRTYAFENSVALWRDVVKKDPKSAFSQKELAVQLRLAANEDFTSGNMDAVKGERNEAIQHAQAALELDPAYASAQRCWANVLVESGDVSGSLPHFVAALKAEQEPKDPELRMECAQALVILGKFDKAIPLLNEALTEKNVDSSKGHSLLGQAYQGKGDFNRAMTEQKIALEKDPANFLARQKLAELEARSDKPADLIAAGQDYALILRSQPNRPDLLLAAADIVRRQGDFVDALTILKEARSKVGPDDKDMLEKVDAAIAQMSHIVATRPSTLPSTAPATTQTAP